MHRRAFIALVATAAATGTARAEDPPYIGTATMLPDGTIEMWLRAEAPDGAIGEGWLVYKPSDPLYREILLHIGGLQPGETKAVPRWPDQPGPDGSGSPQ
jgi:hypothetical protein